MRNTVEWLVQFKANPNIFHRAARKVENHLDQIGRKADRVNSKIGAAFSGKNFASALQGLPVIGSLMNPYLAAVTAIGAGLTAIVRVGSEAEKTSIAFKALVGNEQKAAEMLKEITKFANFTPYKTMDLVDSSKMMLSFGVATDQVIDKIKRLGDIAQGDQNILKSLSLVYGQVSSLGYMQGQDWHQFINAGWNPLQELSEMTGKPMAKLQEMMSKGQIGVKAINAAIEHATSEGGKFYDMSKKQAESVQGRWSTLMGMLDEHLKKLFEQLKPAINWLIEVTPPFFEAVSVEFSKIITETQEIIKAASDIIEEFKGVWNTLEEGYNEFAKINKQINDWFAWLGRETRAYIKKAANWLAELFGIEIPNFGGNESSGKKKDTASAAKKNQEKVQPKKKKYGNEIFGKAKSGKGASGKDANAIATGGTRNTTINMTIGKFFDTMQVTMMDATDTTELETIVVQSLNRALAIATSTDR